MSSQLSSSELKVSISKFMRELAHTFHSFTSNLCVCTDKGNFTNSVMLLCLYIVLPSLESSNFASSFLSQRIVHKLEEHVDYMGLGYPHQGQSLHPQQRVDWANWSQEAVQGCLTSLLLFFFLFCSPSPFSFSSTSPLFKLVEWAWAPLKFVHTP